MKRKENGLYGREIRLLQLVERLENEHDPALVQFLLELSKVEDVVADEHAVNSREGMCARRLAIRSAKKAGSTLRAQNLFDKYSSEEGLSPENLRRIEEVFNEQYAV